MPGMFHIRVRQNDGKPGESGALESDVAMDLHSDSQSRSRSEMS